MRLAGQLSAAIEILTEISERHRPASLALADWGRSHRFAGSRDRSVIGTLVFDVLRNRASLSWRMEDESPRALALAALRFVWKQPVDDIVGLLDGSDYAPPPLTKGERRLLSLAEERLADAPGWVRANVPEWLFDDFQSSFGDAAVAEGCGLAQRAPIDLRVNTLKADRERVLKALSKYGPAATPFSPFGVRIPAPLPQQKNPNVEAEAPHGKGWFEVQDEASQIAVYLSGVAPRLQLLDLCAGSGGKTLGFAALMQNTGQIYAYDSDKQRLRPIFDRLKRSGARNVQVLTAGEEGALEALRGRMDIVFVDAPCSGSGVWRRRPDAKWRLTPDALTARIDEQRQVLELAAPLVKSGGRLIFATCSVLQSENSRQSRWFLEACPGFRPISWRERWEQALPGPAPGGIEGDTELQLTPARHCTDGFYISCFECLR